MANTLKDLAAQLKLVGQDALSQALSDLKAYIDAQDAAGGSDASAAIDAVNAKLDALIGAQEGDVDTILNTFNEIKAFLADYDESDTLKSLIDAATTAAQNAASAAETAAKSYADTKVGDEATRAQAAESALSGRITTLENIDVMTVAEAQKLFESTFFPMTFVDLGLPSGLLWAERNLGAKTVTDDGLYFSWGNVDGHTATDGYDFSGSKYEYNSETGAYSGQTYGATIGGALTDSFTPGGANDAATAMLGSPCKMPTKTNFEELLNSSNCTNAWVTDYQGSGVNGRLFTSVANGKTLFFPASGYFNGAARNSFGTTGGYWSASINESNRSDAYYLHVESNNALVYNTSRYCGHSVRAVK